MGNFRLNDYALAPNPSGGAAQPSKVLWERDSGIHPAVGLVLRLDVGRFNLLVRLHPDLPGGVPAAVMTEVGVAL